MRLSKFLISISFLFFLAIRPVDCFADVPGSIIVEIEFKQNTYFVVLYDLINWEPESPTDTSANSKSRIECTQKLFARENLYRYGDAIRVHKDIVHIPLKKAWPNQTYQSGIFPVDLIESFKLENLSNAEIIRWFSGPSAEEGCVSPLSKTDEYWLKDYPLEITLEIENEIDYVFIRIKDGLTAKELESIKERAFAASDRLKGVDQDAMRLLAKEIHSKHVIVLEYWHY